MSGRLASWIGPGHRILELHCCSSTVQRGLRVAVCTLWSTTREIAASWCMVVDTVSRSHTARDNDEEDTTMSRAHDSRRRHEQGSPHASCAQNRDCAPFTWNCRTRRPCPHPLACRQRIDPSGFRVRSLQECKSTRSDAQSMAAGGGSRSVVRSSRTFVGDARTA